MYKPLLSLMIMSLFSMPLMAGKPIIDTSSTISAVTVFSDRALVTRVIEGQVPQGESTLVIKALPASLHENSLRVTGTADQPLTIGSVESHRRFFEKAVQEQERQLRLELEQLRDERRSHSNVIAALKVQMRFIEAIGKEMPDSINEDIKKEKMEPGTWRNAWSTIGEGAHETLSAMQEREIAIRNIDATIRKKEQELAQIRTGRKQSIEAHIQLEAATAGRVRLELSYQVPGASWSPLYDARLDTKSAKMELNQLGQVRQRTGEDWNGVELTLSTSRPAQGATMPELDTWFIDVLQPRPLLKQERAKAAGAMLEEERLDLAAEAPVTAVKEKKAELISSEFAAEFVIPGRVNVPADNAPHKFAIASREESLALAVQTVPKVAKLAYLYGDYKLEDESALLPGPVNIFRDESYIGATTLPLLRPGEKHKFSFGVDDKVRIGYRLDTGERSSTGLFNKRRQIERRYLMDITNYHDRPIEITVLDQIPVSLDERIEVKSLNKYTSKGATEVEDKTGVLAWSANYAPGEKREIRFGYSVSYPKDLHVPGF